MTTEIAAPAGRMKAEDRRELVLEAATAVFGDKGYVGATTDAVARAAGVSQPYIVRMFGSKEALFLAVLGRALDRLLETFRGAIASLPADATPEERESAMGRAYGDLIGDRGLLLSLMHAFVSGSDPVIGPAAREGFLDVYRLLRQEGGFSGEQATRFLAGGMLLNTLIGIRMGVEIESDRDAYDLVCGIAPTKIDVLARLADAPLAAGADVGRG